MADAILTSEVKDVLSRATTDGNVLFLPEGQLDWKLYEAVNKALTNAGAKWKTRVGHVFPTAAAPKLAAMLNSGVSVDEKKRDQAFFTPDHLAEAVAGMAEVKGHNVLEPSAGRGALADACMAQGARYVHCFEQNQEFVELLRKKYVTTYGNFLAFPPRDALKYERVCMNPPFTKNQDIKHVRHALRFLAPDGILVAIMLNNQTRKGFVDLVAEFEPDITPLERGVFKESGTDVPTLILKIEAPQ